MEGSEHLNLPPAATPSSPLDTDQAPPYWSIQHEFYAPRSFANSTAAVRSQSQPVVSAAPNNRRATQVTENPLSDDAETTSIASSTMPPPYTHGRRYGVHQSEEEYLAALRAWADERQWVQLGDGGLHGFYGDECLEDRSRRMKAERKADKEAKAREKAQKRELARRQTEDGESRGSKRKASMTQWLAKRRQSNAV